MIGVSKLIFSLDSALQLSSGDCAHGRDYEVVYQLIPFIF